jgi:hypothetical protein
VWFKVLLSLFHRCWGQDAVSNSRPIANIHVGCHYMKIEHTIEKYYYLTGDEKSTVGNADPVDDKLSWDFFENKDSSFELSEPLRFKISDGKFSGTIGDYQFNSCGFLLFSNKLRTIVEKYLTDIDNPKWFDARVTDLESKEHAYSILYLFNKVDFLDHAKSTFVTGTDNPIKKRYDIERIGDRLIYNSNSLGTSLCVHDMVRKDIKKSDCSGLYFYKIHSSGRLV